MSAYSLQLLSAKKYFKEFEEKLKCDAESYFFDLHYKVGGGIKNFQETLHNVTMNRILSTDNCTILNYVQDKIDGKLEECGIEKCNRTFNESLQLYKNNMCGQDKCDNECLESACEWHTIQW
jgi:hypothetical protein